MLLFIVITVNLNAQKKPQTFNLKLDNVLLSEVIKKVQKQSNFTFLYNNEQVEKVDSISVVISNGSIEELMNQCLAGTDLGFKIEDDVIVLSPKIEAPKIEKDLIEIIGNITDNDGFPLPGATILENGTSNGVTTDKDGNFSFSVKSENFVLKVSYIGFISQLIPVKDQSFIKVVMRESSALLGEVVVTGYSKIAKERATGSFFQVKDVQLKEQITTNVADRLEGITAGLLFTTENGNGGNKSKITIRGTGAFHTETSPLIVVDGFPIEGNLESINPNDIESINILQDAAAASIWGVQSAGGVIVVTTKSGKKGELQIEYSSYFSSEGSPNMNNLQMASSSDLVNFIAEGIERGMDRNYTTALTRPTALNAVEQVYIDHYDGTLLSTEGITKLNNLKKIDGYKQYSNLLLQNAFSMQHNVSVRGGGERNRFYFSTSYNDDKSVEIGDNSNRLSVLMNNDIDISDKIHIHFGTNLVFQKSNRNAVGLGVIQGQGSFGFLTMPRFQNLVDEDGNRIRLPYLISEDVKQHYEDLGYLDWGYNPLDEIENKDVSSKSVNLRLQFGLEWNVLPSLSWEFKGQYETFNANDLDNKNMSTYYTRHLINTFTYFDDDGNLVSDVPKGSVRDKYLAETQAYTLRSQFNFDKTFADVHQLTGVGGMEVREVNIDKSYHRYYGYDEQSLLFSTTMDWTDPMHRMSYDGSNRSFVNKDRITSYKNRTISTFTNIAYTYLSKYTLTLSGKIDQTNFFGVDARLRANPLWSVGAAWNISQESFFNVGFINMLKLRTSYGVNGNAQKSATLYTTLGKSMDYVLGDYRYRINNTGNPDLKHEDTYNFNLALDFCMFDFKLNGMIEFYSKKSQDLLANFKINPTYGFSSQYLNNGQITNKGIVLNLNAEVLNKKNFKWEANLNLTYNKNRVDKYENDEVSASSLSSLLNTGQRYFYQDNSSNIRYIEGEEMSTILALKWAGLSEDGTPQVYDQNGNIIGFDTNIMDESAFVVAGQVDPPVYGGLTNTFRYKNLSLSLLLTYKFGHVFRRPGGSLDWYSASTYLRRGEVHESISERWREPGDENSTDVPRIPNYDEIGSDYTLQNNYSYYYQYSDHLIESASYIRIRQISLAYTLTEEVLEKLKLPFKQIKFTAQVRNLGMLWTANDYGIDPDVIPFRGGYSALNQQFPEMAVSRPGFGSQAVYTFGVNVQF